MSKLDYGVKVNICAIVTIGGCHACEIEGYALSYPDDADLMAVTLIAPSFKPGCELKSVDADKDTCSLSRALWREAKKPATAELLREAWNERNETTIKRPYRVPRDPDLGVTDYD